MTNWQKWSIWSVIGTIFLPIISKFVETLFEQFGWFDDPQSILAVVFQKIALVFDNTGYQFITIFITGILAGAFLYPLLMSRFGGITTYDLGVELENRYNDIQRNGESFVQSASQLATNQSSAFSLTDISQLRSTFITLRKRGIKTPSIPTPCSIEYLARLGYYCATIYSLLQDNHLKEAKRESKRLSAD